MKKVVLVLLFAGSSAYADWTHVGASDNSDVYVDYASIRKNGRLVKLWALIDYKSVNRSADGKTYLSQRYQEEYDCNQERYKILFYSWHTGNMGTGNTVYSEAHPGEWRPVPPSSISAIHMSIACPD